MIKGVLFDMDGVIVDSEAFIAEAAVRMFAEHGVSVRSQEFLPFVGTGEERYLGGVAEQHGFGFDIARDKARTYAIYGEIIRGRLRPLPGVREFIARCRSMRLKTALASSADRIKLNQNFAEIQIPLDSFDAVVCGTDIARKKPDPEIFLLAASRCGLSAGECLVVEDAVNGVAAAKSAGARCLGLTTSFTPAQLSGADWFAPNLAHAPSACLEW
jgi:beta-phosphoglucomutase